MIKILTYLKPFLPATGLAVLLLFGQALCDLYLPNLMASIVNVGIVQGQTDQIFLIGIRMLFVAFLGGTAAVLVNLLSVRVSTGISRNLRHDLFQRVESFSSNEFDRFSTASLITRCTNDVTQVQHLTMMGIRMLAYAPIMAAGGIVMAVRKSLSMSWIIALAVIVLLCMVIVVMSIALPRFKIIQKQVDRLNLVARENLSGLMVIRAFVAEHHEKERFDAVNRDLTRTNLFVNRIMVFMMPSMTLIMNGVTLLVVLIGGHRIAESEILVGDMMAFMQYAMLVIISFLMLSMMFIMIPRAAVSAQRVGEILAVISAVTDPETPMDFSETGERTKGVLEFRNVSFRYRNAEQDALTDISFTALPGRTTAIIGATGAGKSTIANLILRFYDVCEGEIMVDHTDIRKVRQKDLRNKIGYVSQKAVLLSGTIRSNIRYGKEDATLEEIERVAEVAQASDFVKERPEGLDAEISQGGTNVSGGQKQRLSIARALARKPEILIFDDSFSSLDFRTDAKLRKALKEYSKESTVIMIAQRINTIMNADQILVLEQGRIAGRGTHKELLSTCQEYRDIALSQLTAEELG